MTAATFGDGVAAIVKAVKRGDLTADEGLDALDAWWREYQDSEGTRPPGAGPGTARYPGAACPVARRLVPMKES